MEAVEVEDWLLCGCRGVERSDAVGEPLIVDVKDGPVVASFAADADLGLASALARGDVDRADAERFADPKAAQEQQCDERPFGDLRPVLSCCEERVRPVAVEAEVRVLVLDGRPAHAQRVRWTSSCSSASS